MSLEAAIAAAWPPAGWADTNVVVAVSGGADSCALLVALTKLKYDGRGAIVAAHFNHGLRGASGDEDAVFVDELAESLGVRAVVGHGDVATAAQLAGDGIEAAARTARYRFLRETAEQCGARYVATGHTADDQVETVLQRILRGTGIGGLAGMRAARRLSETVTLIRPLLAVRRSEVLHYLRECELSYRDDETNADRRFTRNRLRNELLPQLRRDFNADVDAALLRLSHLAGENQEVIDSLIDELAARAVQSAGNSTTIDTSILYNQPRHLIRELFVNLWGRKDWPQQAMGLAQWDALADLILADAAGSDAQRIFPGNIQATKKGEQLTLTRLG